MSSSATHLISDSERAFIIHSVQDNHRIDGRQCLDYRMIEVETNKISSCNGSGHVRLGNNEVLVGIKGEVEEPSPTRPKEGRIEFFVDLSANASPEFSGRGGEDIAEELAIFCDHAYHDCLDLESLCIVPGKQVWGLHIDILVLEFGSRASLFDAAGIAIKAALYNTRLPKIDFGEQEEEGSDEEDYDIADDPSSVFKLDISRVPLFITLTKINAFYCVDVTQEEEIASISSMTLAIDSRGNVLHLKKFSGGSLNPEPFKDILPRAQQIAIGMHSNLAQKLHQELEILES